MTKRLFGRGMASSFGPDPAPEERAKEGASPTALELARLAFAQQSWAEAARHFEAELSAGSTSREAWLGAASAHDRLGAKDLASAFTRLGNRLAPSTRYDSTAAFAAYGGAPAERDAMANFFLDRAPELRAAALARVEGASTVVHERPTDESSAVPFMPSAAIPAFVFWDTSERPPIVQRCIQSMRQHLPEWLELRELDASALIEEIDLPPEATTQVTSMANLSDVLRLHVLSNVGGLWIDATCLLGDGFLELAQRVAREDFFAFTYRGSRTGSWFLWARPESYRLQLIRVTLDAWLNDGRAWNNYFMFHDIVEMLYWTDERYRSEWDAGLYLHPREALKLNKALGRRVAEHEWFDLRHRSPINKLTWKFDQAKAKDPTTAVARLLAELPPELPAAPGPPEPAAPSP